MGHVVEAFRFLSARVETLEARLAAQDRPVDGPAWLVPARELGALAGPVAAHVLARTPGGVIIHADCGEGDLLRALHERGAEAHGVEPRGAVALRAIEHGCSVTIAEASEHLASRADGSTGRRRVERRGRPAAPARAAPAARPRAGGCCGAGHRSSWSPSPSRPTELA